MEINKNSITKKVFASYGIDEHGKIDVKNASPEILAIIDEIFSGERTGSGSSMPYLKTTSSYDEYAKQAGLQMFAYILGEVRSLEAAKRVDKILLSALENAEAGARATSVGSQNKYMEIIKKKSDARDRVFDYQINISLGDEPTHINSWYQTKYPDGIKDIFAWYNNGYTAKNHVYKDLPSGVRVRSSLHRDATRFMNNAVRMFEESPYGTGANGIRVIPELNSIYN